MLWWTLELFADYKLTSRMYQADCLLHLCQPSGKQSHLGVVGKRCRTLLSPYGSANAHNNYVRDNPAWLTNKNEWYTYIQWHVFIQWQKELDLQKFQSMDGVANAFRDQECCSTRTLECFINVLLWVSACTCIRITNFKFMFRGRLLQVHDPDHTH